MSLTLADLRPGDLMFGPIGGFVPGIMPVGVGQVLLANRRARLSWKRWWKVRHCGVVVHDARCGMGTCDYHPPRLVQAMPHGAEEIELTEQHWTPEYVYIRPAYKPFADTTFPRGEQVAHFARSYLGTPYNFLTYGKLAASVLRMGATEALLRKWISTRHDMMCSQLVDQCLTDAGFHVFDDGRLPQDVVPAELYRRMMQLPGTWTVGGQGSNWVKNYWGYPV